MYLTLRTKNTGRTETIYLPFMRWSDVDTMRTYYAERGLIVVEVKDGTVCI